MQKASFVVSGEKIDGVILMGLMDFLGFGPMSEKRIGRSVKLAMNAFAQPDVRVRELEKLLDDGSDDAIKGALKRFSVNASGTIADEEEKKWLEDEVVEKCGDSALLPLEHYIRSEKQLTYALRAYRRLTPEAASLDFFISALEGHGPDAYKQADAKLQLILQLSEYIDNSTVLTTLAPFLMDHSDDVRWAVMDIVEAGVVRGSVSNELKEAYLSSFSEILSDSSTGPRIVRRAAQFLSDYEWALSLAEGEFPVLLEDDYFLDKKGFIRKRVGRSS